MKPANSDSRTKVVVRSAPDGPSWSTRTDDLRSYPYNSPKESSTVLQEQNPFGGKVGDRAVDDGGYEVTIFLSLETSSAVGTLTHSFNLTWAEKRQRRPIGP